MGMSPKKFDFYDVEHSQEHSQSPVSTRFRDFFFGKIIIPRKSAAESCIPGGTE